MAALALGGGLLTLALLAKPTQAQAQTEHFNERTLQVFEFFGCTGELVSVEGTLHVVGTTTQDADGKLHVQGHSNFGGKGVGLTSGAEYVVRELGNQAAFAEDINDPFGSASFTQTYTLRVMRKGSPTPEDDFLLTFLEHITINANGEVTAQVGEFRSECR